ncbi:MAG: hypothetical protein ACJAZY_002873 [Spirosomataceae bacterium]|jgi:hypothetical protein
MKDYKNDNRTSQEIDEERVIQTNSNLGLVDARPGESTLQTGTKNHSNKLDHAYSIEDDLKAVDPDAILSTEELKKTLELENEGLHLDTKTSKPKEQ